MGLYVAMLRLVKDLAYNYKIYTNIIHDQIQQHQKNSAAMFWT